MRGPEDMHAYCLFLSSWLTTTQFDSQQLRGKHFVVNMIKSMFMEAGTDGAFINHSLQVTADADLFQAGVPEMVI